VKTLDAFVYPNLCGAVPVHDRYQNYDAVPGVLHQLCTQHILPDLEHTAQSYPGAVRPGQATGAVRPDPRREHGAGQGPGRRCRRRHRR
jgi:hypothetical protein